MSRLLAAQPDPAAVEAALNAEIVHAVLLLELRFASGTVRLSNSMQAVTDLQSGATWEGLGDLVGIGTAEAGPDQLAPYREYLLGMPWSVLDAESDPTRAMARIPELLGNPADYRSREAILYLQLMDMRGDAHGRPVPIGVPVALDAGLMDHVEASYSPSAVMLRMTVEGLLARKGIPAFGLLTSRDQQRRHPGDTGLEFVPEVMSTNPKWTDW